MKQHLTNRRKTWFQSPWMAVILALLVILGGLSVVRAFAKEREAAKLRNQYRKELSDMESRETELNRQIENLSTDRGLEEEIRERYRVAKPGEELVVVVDNGTVPNEKTPTFWMKVRAFIGI